MNIRQAITSKGFLKTHREVRQLITDGRLFVNGEPVTSPDMEAKEGDVVTIKGRQFVGKEFRL